jgi:hypothetical protein
MRKRNKERNKQEKPKSFQRKLKHCEVLKPKYSTKIVSNKKYKSRKLLKNTNKKMPKANPNQFNKVLYPPI